MNNSDEIIKKLFKCYLEDKKKTLFEILAKSKKASLYDSIHHNITIGVPSFEIWVNTFYNDDNNEVEELKYQLYENYVNENYNIIELSIACGNYPPQLNSFEHYISECINKNKLSLTDILNRDIAKTFDWKELEVKYEKINSNSRE